MTTTKDLIAQGRQIKKEHETIREQKICKAFGFKRVTTNKQGKKDGICPVSNRGLSCKAAKNPSTQVHLTTLAALQALLCLSDEALLALSQFLGTQTSRLRFDKIDPNLTHCLVNEFNEKSDLILSIILGSKQGVDIVAYHNLKTDEMIGLSVDSTSQYLSTCVWAVGSRKGSLELRKDGKRLFHLQRKGSGKTGRNGAMFHIHWNLFDALRASSVKTAEGFSKTHY